MRRHDEHVDRLPVTRYAVMLFLLTAILTGEISGPRDKSVLARVEVGRGPDGWTAAPTGGRGSNLIATVARANGLALLAPGVERAGPGEHVRVRLFRSSED